MSAELFLHACDVKCCIEGIIRLENVMQGFAICIAAVIEVFWFQTLTLCMVTKSHGKGEVESPAQVCTKAALTHLKDASGVQFCQVLMFSSESRVGEMQ